MAKYCWACGKDLATDSSGRPIYTVYIDPAGNAHELHKVCYDLGYKQKPVTAQPPEQDLDWFPKDKD